MSLLGIDIGTTGCKAIVFRVDGQALAHAYREYPLIHPREGWAELNPEAVWACVSEAVAEAVDRAGPGDPVKALGTSVQGEAVTTKSAELPRLWTNSGTRSVCSTPRALPPSCTHFTMAL